MFVEIDEALIKPAKAAHELYMVNLGTLLLLGPMAIFLGIGRLGIVLPMLASLFFILFTYYRSWQLARSGPWFVFVHWRLALSNYRLLGVGFALTLLFLVISWLLERSLDPESPSHFLAIALTRIGVMPTIVMILVCFVIENGALNQVLRHEVPDRMVRSHPPPPGLPENND